MSLTLRNVKGSPLTYTEMDNNLTYLEGLTSNTKIYRAFITQTGTGAPVATVLENTFGGTIVFTRDSAGAYIATLAGAFTLNKTIINNTGLWGGGMTVSNVLIDGVNVSGYITFTAWSDANQIRFYSQDASFIYTDLSVLDVNPLFIEIITYP